MRPLFITIDLHDKTAWYILILIGSNVLKTELDVIGCLRFYYFLSCEYKVIIQIICNNFFLKYKVICTIFSHCTKPRRWLVRV